MAGIYIHIPYCKKACYYCDFHFSTSLKSIDSMIRCIRNEISFRKDFLGGEAIHTIYFGGGTPSIMPAGDIGRIIGDIHKQFPVALNPEITLEANPDDITEIKLTELRDAGINRLSIGIQSFSDYSLKKLNRVHDSSTAMQSLDAARRAGFRNINADLIFSIYPGYLPELKNDLLIMKRFLPEHLSLYCLTIEPRTVFGNWQKKGTIIKGTDDEAAVEYEFIMDELEKAGYDHYEISNFAMDGFQSKHNMGYWLGEKYLGVGPSAHSYDLHNRYSNISNNALYVKNIENNIIPSTADVLSPTDRINEYIMTSLRTKWGCNLDYIKNHFGRDMLPETESLIRILTSHGYIEMKGNVILLTRKGKLVADEVISRMFIS